jgi:uncharacterized protein (DUF736 family)
MAYGTVNADVIGTSTANSNLGAGNATIMKNRIINGDMYVAQRATSATITAGSTIAAGYATVDRFYGYCTGANVTMAQVAGTGNNRNLLQFTGAASVTAIGVGQRIEALNSYDLAGSTVTLSAYLANSLLTTVTWTAYYANTTDTFGTLASPTRTSIATGTFTVTSTLTQYNAQIAIPAAATTGIEIVFTVGAQISGTFQIGLVQLEVGPNATGYEYNNYQTQLANCQRYYYRWIPTANATDQICSGWAYSTVAVFASIQFPVTMRIRPTALEQSGTASDYRVVYGNANITAATGVPAFSNASYLSANMSIATAAVLTANGGITFQSATVNGYLGWSAEL